MGMQSTSEDPITPGTLGTGSAAGWTRIIGSLHGCSIGFALAALAVAISPASAHYLVRGAVALSGLAFGLQHGKRKNTPGAH